MSLLKKVIRSMEEGNNSVKLLSTICRKKEEEPFCCSACGGPYPHCMDSCPIFED